MPDLADMMGQPPALQPAQPPQDPGQQAGGLLQFIQQLQQNSQVSDQKEPDIMEKLKSSPASVKVEPDTLDPLADEQLKGFFESQKPTDLQTVQDFDKQFRKSISPAREFLANFLMGFGSSMTGQKFKSVRDQRYEEWQTDQKMQMEQQQKQFQQQATTAQIANSIREHFHTQQMEADIENAKLTQTQADQQRLADQFKVTNGLSLADYNLKVAEFLQKKEVDAQRARHELVDETKVNNPNYQQAANEVSAAWMAKKMNPADQQLMPRFLQDVATRKQTLDLQQVAEKAKEPKTALAYIPQPDGTYKVAEVGGGATLPKGAMTEQQMGSQEVPTTATRNMAEKAPRVLYFVDRLNNLIDANEKQLGPLEGRWKQFQQGKIGLPNQGVAQMRADLGLLETALMNMHVGARGGEGMMEHFHNLIGDLKQDPSNLKAALGEVKTYAQEVAKEGLPKTIQDLQNQQPQGFVIGGRSPGGGKIVSIVPVK